MSYATWSASQVYSINDVVRYLPNNVLYVSLQNGNLNNNPTTVGTSFWSPVGGGGSFVNSLNAESGNLTITGINGVSVSNTGANFVVSGTGGISVVNSVQTSANDSAGALFVSPNSGNVVANLKPLTAPVQGLYNYPTAINIDQYGRATSLAGGNPLSGVVAGSGLATNGVDTLTNTGVLSVNSQSGAVSVQSAGNTIAITNPSAGVINLEGNVAGFVPYTGATQPLNMGNNNIVTAASVQAQSTAIITTKVIGVMGSANNFQTRLYNQINFPSGNQSVNVWTFDTSSPDSTYILSVNSGEGNMGQCVLSLSTFSPSLRQVGLLAGQITGGSFQVINGSANPSVTYSYSGHASSGTGFAILENIVVSP